MKSKFLETTELYDGSQLVSLRSYLRHHILGDSIVAWVGPCDVAIDHMVDGEDLLAHARICGGQMVHFILETFDTSLMAAVALQRLFASTVKDQLDEMSKNSLPLVRDGDDIYSGSRKLSISIATQSPVSSLIHFAVNVTNKGTPVETLSLQDLDVDPRAFADAVMVSFCAEYQSVRNATRKVRWVK